MTNPEGVPLKGLFGRWVSFIGDAFEYSSCFGSRELDIFFHDINSDDAPVGDFAGDQLDRYVEDFAFPAQREHSWRRLSY